MIKTKIDHLLSKVDSKFTLVVAAAKRAREINDYFNKLGKGLSEEIPPLVETTSKNALTIALEEIDQEKFKPQRTVEGIK